jgi:DNA-binding CsgD family transcriptional regulator
VLRASDFSQVVKVGKASSACQGVDQLRAEVLNMVPDVFGVERANFILVHPYPSPWLDFENMASRGIDPKYAVLFREHYWRVDPIFRAISLPQTVISLKDLFPRNDLCESEWYHGFVKPQHGGDVIGINLRAGHRLLGVLALVRTDDESPFSPRETVKAELIAPYLAAAIEKENFAAKARKTEKIINTICRDLPYAGIVVLDESCASIYANEEARSALAGSADSAVSSENTFVPIPEGLHAHCKKLFRSPHTTEPVKKEHIELTFDGVKQTVPVNLSLVRDSHNTRLCLVCIGRSEGKTLPEAHLNKLGLTRRESEIVGFVCGGLKNGEIGRKLFISEATVENHLHSIFGKTGVKNRASLVYRVTHSDRK